MLESKQKANSSPGPEVLPMTEVISAAVSTSTHALAAVARVMSVHTAQVVRATESMLRTCASVLQVSQTIIYCRSRHKSLVSRVFNVERAANGTM